MNTKHLILIMIIFGVLLTGCTGENPTQEIFEPGTEGYPVQGEETAYPVEEFSTPVDEGYPIEESTPLY